jgi:AraC-like DNA-binding protein
MYILSASETILFFICGFGILQGILLSALIYFHPKSDKSVTIFLALYILCTSGIMTMPLIMQIVGWGNSFFIQPIPLTTGPFLYLYIRSFKEQIGWRKAWPHFIPFFAFFFLSYWNIWRLNTKYPRTDVIPLEAMNNLVSVIFISVKPAQQVIYYFLARKTLNAYQRSIRHLFSETSKIDLNWAKFLINGYIILVIAFIIMFPIMLRNPGYFYLLLLINMALAVPYIYIASYKGFIQPSIWQIQSGIKKETVEEEMHLAEEIETGIVDSKKPATVKSGLSAERIQELVKKITILMEGEKLYQETELTLQQLADKLKVPAYQVSQSINEGMKKNFYDLINEYRVREAKRLLLDLRSNTYTILSVGFEAGFNSKTTFNTVFKKFTGFTPTEYRNKESAGLAAV